MARPEVSIVSASDPTADGPVVVNITVNEGPVPGATAPPPAPTTTTTTTAPSASTVAKRPTPPTTAELDDALYLALYPTRETLR